MSIFLDDLEPVAKKAPVQNPEQKQYGDVLKKIVRPSQLNRLKKRADARAEQDKVSDQNPEATAEKLIQEKALQ